MNTDGGGTSGDVGHVSESVSGAERPEPNVGDLLSSEDVRGSEPLPEVNTSQLTVQALLALRATLAAAIQQTETALLLNGVVLQKSSPRRAAPETGEKDTETVKTFGGPSVEVPKNRGM